MDHKKPIDVEMAAVQSSSPKVLGNNEKNDSATPTMSAVDKMDDEHSYLSKVDHAERRNQLGCMEEKASIFSWLTISFLSPVFDIGIKRPLSEDDLGVGLNSNQPKHLWGVFFRKWNRTKKNGKKAGFTSSLFAASGVWNWIFAMTLNVAVGVLSFLPTYIMRDLIRDLQDGFMRVALTDNKRWFLTIMLFVCPAAAAFLQAIAMLILVRVSIRFKTIASDAIYRKTLKLSSSAKGLTSTGQILNIMSQDTVMLQMFVMILMVVVMIPVFLVLSLQMIYDQMSKNIMWIALGMYVGMIVLQFLCAGMAFSMRSKAVAATDSRVKLINEVLNGIRVIKFYCWEKPFKGKIAMSRQVELKLITRMSMLMTTVFEVLLLVIPQFVPVVCFGVYNKVTGEALDSTIVFTCLTCFGNLAMPFAFLPMSLIMTTQFLVSLKRINTFLALPEVEEDLVLRNASSDRAIEYKLLDGSKKNISMMDYGNDAVVIQDGYFAWGKGENVLNNVNVRIKKGHLVAIVGRVGSGKTSFVSTLLGELTRNAGIVIANGSMAYSSQQAWLVNDTLQNNVLFGLPYDKQRYERVIELCCMKEDLKVLSGGDQCEIGEKGINLSGGQKARVSLARCAYSNSDIMIMDDPLAAVDAHVGKALFNHLIRKNLEGKTRILVTNATQYLHRCDYVVVIDKQSVVAQGTYQELKDRNVDFVSLLNEEDMSSSANKSSAHDKKPDTKPAEATTTTAGDGGLVGDESKASGRMEWGVYKSYFKSIGYFICYLILILFAVATVANVMGQFWVSDWSEDFMNLKRPLQSWINGYIMFNFIVCALQIIRSYASVPARVKAGRNLHKALTESIMSTPVSFHDVTPVGRILNRFSKDFETIDHQLPMQLTMAVSQTFVLLGNLVNMAVKTRGIILVVIALALPFFYFIQLKFRRSNTDIQRIESLTRSPIYTDFQGMLNGTPSIRAFGHQARFIEGIETKLDRNSHVLGTLQVASAWLGIRTELICAVLVFAVGAIVVILKYGMKVNVKGSDLGLALQSSLSVGQILKQLVKTYATAEAQMNSVERVQEYIDNVEAEPPQITEKRPPPGWPNNGEIQFDNVQLKYRDGPLVLRGVTAYVKSKEKIGIVGRTGAGKSSMMIALFRITDYCGGSISIDGVKLHEIGLEDVRRALCIIPQDPVLFCETVRFNIDPFEEYSDDDIWNVLEMVDLKEAVKKLDKGIQGLVHEGGSNFSVGERQLLCMARALLRKPKVLILDEATASLDNETDKYLQMMLRKSFKQCTTLTIAHRLNTIMDSDRVMVMDKGVVAELDSPFNLLHADGIFKGMVNATKDNSLYDMVPGCSELKPDFLTPLDVVSVVESSVSPFGETKVDDDDDDDDPVV